jgi:hypothetical protein
MWLVQYKSVTTEFRCPAKESLDHDRHLPILICCLADQNQGLGLGDFQIDYSSQSICLRERG